jgi:iron complex outermembrane receptor protein
MFAVSIRAQALMALGSAVLAGRVLAADAFVVSGTIHDESGHALAAADVVLDDGDASTVSDASGAYRLTAPAGRHTLRFRHRAHLEATLTLDVTADAAGVDVALLPLYRVKEDVFVRAIRADEKAPITTTDLSRADIQLQNFGQEMPVLLKQQPSMTFYSDTGTGFGYAYFYLRGIHQTRINMTLDGVPLNDAEDSALYFVDFVDLASSIESLQIQRGVGTSSVGAASFGGSINFASADLADERGIGGDIGAGSFGSYRGSLGLQSGRFGPGLAAYARGTYQTTDGFRDHSGVSQRSAFYGASWQGERTLARLFGFSGHERTELAFLAVEKDVLDRDLRANPLSSQETDSFGQSMLRAQVTRFLSPRSSLAFQAYHNGAGGWYRLWDDASARTNLLQYGLHWRYLGGMVTFNHAGQPLDLTLGVHGYDFRSNHTQEVVGGGRTYGNDNVKNDASAFAKLAYDAGRWHFFGDGQWRWARFEYDGSLDLGSNAWAFFNPRLGVRYQLHPRLSAYASVGKATREPTRSDLLAGEDNASLRYDLTSVRPERVVDVEAGLDLRTRRFVLAANAYAMEFRNEIALTGELSAIGLPLRRNVDRSYRRGVELDARWEPSARWRFTANANLSHNRIRTWPQSYDVYDVDGNYEASEVRASRGVVPLLTPARIVNLGMEWTPRPDVSLGLAGRHVGRTFLDNTNRADLDTPSFATLDAMARFGLERWIRGGHPRLRLIVSNLLDDHRLFVSGYSYLFATRDAEGRETPGGVAYYYPQATRAAFVRLEFGF